MLMLNGWQILILAQLNVCAVRLKTSAVKLRIQAVKTYVVLAVRQQSKVAKQPWPCLATPVNV